VAPQPSRHLARIAPAGTSVRLVTDPRSGDTRDRYGRLLAYVDSRRGDLGEHQLRAGLATVNRYQGRRFSRLDRYREAEKDARTSNRGTWSACSGDFHAAPGP
jgi:endonuclease YncB( thermonuclease family)